MTRDGEPTHVTLIQREFLRGVEQADGPVYAVIQMSEVTSILEAADQGDPRAAEQLLPLVYAELRKLAAARLARENPGQTLTPTALVHEAYVRLVDVPQAQPWNGRGHFFAAAAEAMRRILVDQARRRKAAKRGGDAAREELHESALAAPRPPEALLAVNDVLDDLAEIDPVAANLVKLRFFVGLNMTETAAVLGVSVRSAHDIWAYARSWLHQRIRAE
jgi:RNA polymerase sigma factor (TIGR02999 family)